MLIRAPDAHFERPRLFAFSNNARLAVWDRGGETGRPTVTVDGVAARRPYGTVTVPLAQGRSRTLIAFRVPEGADPETALLHCGERRIEFVPADPAQAPAKVQTRTASPG